jgi:hypothetical protein
VDWHVLAVARAALAEFQEGAERGEYYLWDEVANVKVA